MALRCTFAGLDVTYAGRTSGKAVIERADSFGTREIAGVLGTSTSHSQPPILL